ncbi:energy-coupling factor transporter ATPase [Saccharibacillus sp. O16]|nr:energy-coupling factor transporter ATPase [Saccharibacillus sp. O16]
MLEFRDVSFHYHKDKPILRGVDFSLAAGEFVCVVGRNGCGKSTLARLTNGLAQPRGGKVFVNGLNPAIPADLPAIRQQVGFIFQNPDDQFITSSVSDEIVFGLENMRVPREEMDERIRQALLAVDLTDYAHAAPHELSGGQKQRAAVAAVLAMRPNLVIFDEATSMLDPRGRSRMLALMQSLHQQGMTLLHITHHMDEVMAAQRVLLLDQGKIAFDGTPANLFAGSLPQSYGMEKPFSIRVHEALGWTGTPVFDWKERARLAWKLKGWKPQ